MPDIVACPDPACEAPALVERRWTWPSSDGPVEHAKTACTDGHWFTPPAASLIPYRRPNRVSQLQEAMTG
jgi:hypothetical protein